MGLPIGLPRRSRTAGSRMEIKNQRPKTGAIQRHFRFPISGS